MAASPDNQLEFELVRFTSEAEPADFLLDIRGETLWATGSEIATLFRVPAVQVARTIAAVFADGELTREEVVRPGPAPAAASNEGDARPVAAERYSLDMILSVGYRLNGVKATKFRQWASRLLRALMVDGFALDEARLRADKGARNALAARLRAIRADEASVYDSVRAFFAEGATDYEADSEACRRFNRLMEDKFVFAVTGQTPDDLIEARADHDKPAMGLQRFEGGLPSIEEARIAQNYLDAHELFVLHVLCEQFLLLVEQKASRGQPMTMRDLVAALDGLLRLDDYPVLPHHKTFHAARAVRHAQAEYARFILRAGARTVAR